MEPLNLEMETPEEPTNEMAAKVNEAHPVETPASDRQQNVALLAGEAWPIVQGDVLAKHKPVDNPRYLFGETEPVRDAEPFGLKPPKARTTFRK